jgi:hypothetical protein
MYVAAMKQNVFLFKSQIKMFLFFPQESLFFKSQSLPASSLVFFFNPPNPFLLWQM